MLLNGQQDPQRQSLNMIQEINCRHEYDNVMWDIPIYDSENMDLVDWLLQIEKWCCSQVVKSMNWQWLSLQVNPN